MATPTPIHCKSRFAADTSPSFASSGTSRSAIVGQYFSFTRPSASGGNGSLSYSVSGTCPGLTVTTSSVSGQPSSAGQCGITWTVTDADGDTDTYSLQISVAADTSPSFASSGTSRSAIVGQYFSFTRPSASGGNGSLSYSVSGTCPGLTVTTSSVSGAPSSAGQCGITWTVSDSRWRYRHVLAANLGCGGYVAFVCIVGHVPFGDCRAVFQLHPSFGQWRQWVVELLSQRYVSGLDVLQPRRSVDSRVHPANVESRGR